MVLANFGIFHYSIVIFSLVNLGYPSRGLCGFPRQKGDNNNTERNKGFGKERYLFSKVFSGALKGIEGSLVQVEADVGNGLPGFQLVGYLAAEVKEAQDRVRTALKNEGFRLSAMKITVNLSPANIRKEGTAFDLPIAVAVLASYGQIGHTELLADSAFIGELGLDGSVKSVKGTLSLVTAFRDAGIKRCFLPTLNLREGLAIHGIDVIPVERLSEAVHMVNSPEQLCPARRSDFREEEPQPEYSLDYREVNGQRLLKRATEIAVAGHHNILYIGPAGSGKSMVARRIPTIMPSLSCKERLEVSKVYSVCGLLPRGKALLTERPFRSPHHTISPLALAGGGNIPRPGEISLASRGVLFLDEFPEFQRRTIEVLRQPLEERKITVSRAYGACEFPADFMLAAAMNPCPCGHYPDRNRCTCQDSQIRRYLGKISGPLLDRIDICVEAAPVTYQEVRGEETNESSADIRKRVEEAWEIQKERFYGTSLCFNSEMGGKEIKRYCCLQREEEVFLQEVYQKLGLSARGCQRILKVARTIADLDGKEEIERIHLSEAAGYRSLEEKYWGREA